MCASVIATWSFSQLAVNEIVSCLQKGDSVLHALERGINVVEDDPDTGKHVVGRGGFPNERGILECDAAVMCGNGCRFGAVAAIQGVATPFSVAKMVMERSPHSILVGEGAQEFAKENGISILNNELLQTESSAEAHKEFLESKKKKKVPDLKSVHDTIGVLVKDFEGNIVAGTSTSGKPFKSCGRVGDSPIPGAGLYADNEVGAVAATGDGDNILRFCPCFHVIQLMKNRVHPKQACELVVMDIWRRVGEDGMFEIGLIAMNKKGQVGMASTVKVSPNHFGSNSLPGFAFCVWNSEENRPRVLCEPPLVWNAVHCNKS